MGAISWAKAVIKSLIDRALPSGYKLIRRVVRSSINWLSRLEVSIPDIRDTIEQSTETEVFVESKPAIEETALEKIQRAKFAWLQPMEKPDLEEFIDRELRRRAFYMYKIEFYLDGPGVGSERHRYWTYYSNRVLSKEEIMQTLLNKYFSPASQQEYQISDLNWVSAYRNTRYKQHIE